ncbi:hypothetical protein LT493_32575 [Streptomyces tricolor]|nr:hypothetical protein [Streptomyces tricolor]
MVFGWIDEQAEARRRAGLVRTLRPRPADSPLLDLASNTTWAWPAIRRSPAAAEAARTWGGGSTGSRLVTGTTALPPSWSGRWPRSAGSRRPWCSPPGTPPTWPRSPRSARPAR